MMRAIAVVAILAASPTLAGETTPVSPVIFEPQPPCTGPECSNLFLEVQDHCVWAQNIERLPVVLTLTLANGTTVPITLKSATSYTVATAPYYDKQCETIQLMVQRLNEHGHGEAAVGFIPQLKKCHADDMAAREANVKKDEYYDSGSRPVRRRSTIGLGGSFMSTETYPTYWLRLKIEGKCVDALHVIKSTTAALK